MTPGASLCIFLSILLVAVAAIVIKGRRFESHQRPPGPSLLHLLRDISQLRRFPWLQLTKWHELYGPIFSLSLAGRSVVVINDSVMAAELLDRRSHIYSDRPRLIMVGELFTGGFFLPLMQYGDLWKRMRRAAHEGFSNRATTAYHRLQEKHATHLVSHILESPDNWDDHVRRSAASIVLSVVYGWPPIDATADSLVEKITAIIHRLARATLPGSHLVDIMPIMAYIPDEMAKWKREAKAHYHQDSQFFEGLFNDVKTKVLAGTAEPCFVATLVEDKHDLDIRSMAWLCGTLFGAGAETTAGSLSVFILAMTLYPEIMRRAQAQIDAVVGRDRLPNFGDRAQLPYIEAVVKEVQRWRPGTPIGVPRQTTEDDFYNGYFIPKGTLVLLNVWAINRDPGYFPDFDEFRPERYLDEREQLIEPMPNTHAQGHMSYGTGRRMCVGKDLANQTLFIDFATLLWTCNIDKAIGADGNSITPSRTDFVDEGVVIRPAPFSCSITPRFPEALQLIQAATETFV